MRISLTKPISLATTTLVAALPFLTLAGCGEEDPDFELAVVGTGGASAGSTGGAAAAVTGGSTAGTTGGSTASTAGGASVGTTGGSAAAAMGGATAATTGGSTAGTTGGAASGGTPPASGGTAPASGGTTSASGGAEHQGGAVSSGGMASSGGSGAAPPVGGAGAEPDCNSVSGQPIVTVAADGSGDHKSVEAAVKAVGKGNKTPTQIRIKPGIYKERFTLETPMITLCGEAGKAAETVIVGSGKGTSTGFTILFTANDVSVENLTIQNTVTAGQAPAVMTKSQRTQFRNCRILGYQDTLYAHSGTQYYRNCYIEGRVDYIFGGATAVYENCEMRTVEGGSAICAPSTKPDVPFGLVFLGGKATAVDKIKKGSQNLARSWGKNGATHYIGTVLDDHIKPTGWASMKKENKVSEARFGEFGTTGEGANPGARTKEVKVMTQADADKFTIKNIFGSWTPSFSK